MSGVILSMFVLSWLWMFVRYQQHRGPNDPFFQANDEYGNVEWEWNVLDYCANFVVLGVGLVLFYGFIGWFILWFVGGVLSVFGVKVDWGSIWLFWKTFFGLK